MANQFLTSDIITKEALRVFHEELIFTSKCNTQYDGSFKSGANVGDTIRIRKPAKYKVRSGKTRNAQDVIESNISLKVDKQLGIDVDFTDADLALDLNSFSDTFLRPAMSQLASSIEQEVIKEILKAGSSVYNASGIAYNDTLKARKSLEYSLAPKGNRVLLIDPATSIGLVDELKGLFQDSTQIAAQYRNGLMGVTSGFKFYETNLLPTYTQPSDVTATVTVSEGGSTATFAGLGASETIPAGFRFTVAGLKKVHPETKRAYNELYEFVVQEDFTTDGAGAGVGIILPVYASGTDARQNASGTLPSGAAISVNGAAGDVLRNAIAFAPDFVTFATADLNVPKGCDMASKMVMDGFSLRFVRDFDIHEGDMQSRFDILFGTQVLYPEYGCLLQEPDV